MDAPTDFMIAMGRSSRRVLERAADEIGLEGEQRKEMLKISDIIVQGVGFVDVYGSAT